MYQFQKALGSSVIVSPFICEILLTHIIDTIVNKCHEVTDGPTYFSLQ